jgi:hypothetical protein
MARDINSYRAMKPSKATQRGMIARANARDVAAAAEAAKAAKLDAEREAARKRRAEARKRKEEKRDADIGFVARGHKVAA